MAFEQEEYSVESQIENLINYLSRAAAGFQEADDPADGDVTWEELPKGLQKFRDEIEAFRDEAWDLVEKIEKVAKKHGYNPPEEDEDPEDDDEGGDDE